MSDFAGGPSTNVEKLFAFVRIGGPRAFVSTCCRPDVSENIEVWPVEIPAGEEGFPLVFKLDGSVVSKAVVSRC